MVANKKASIVSFFLVLSLQRNQLEGPVFLLSTKIHDENVYSILQKGFSSVLEGVVSKYFSAGKPPDPEFPDHITRMPAKPSKITAS